MDSGAPFIGHVLKGRDMLKKKTIFLYLLFSIFFPHPAFAERDSANFIAMSDIHFNPFDLCINKVTKKECLEFMAELNRSNADNWGDIFEKYYKDTLFSSYGQDTNYPLFQSFLSEIHNIFTNNGDKNEYNIKFAVILGDFLGHQYHKNYKLYSGDTSQAGFEKFVKKTFQYLTFEIRAAIPTKIEIYPVLGNNDSYIENYNVDNPKTSHLYSDLKVIWNIFSPQIKNSSSFANGGYYFATTAVKGLSVIAFNTTLFSRNAINKDKNDLSKVMKEQWKWINNQFENSKNQKILMISHIPFGIDAYSSANSMKKGGEPVTFWKEDSNLIEKPYLKILNDHFSLISGILVSHTHHDTFQIIDNDLGLYSVSTPSVSPLHHTNSSFKIFTLDELNNLKNSITYYLDKSDSKWKKLYDFNDSYESQNLSIGMQSLVGKWLKDPQEVDTKYLNYFTLGVDPSNIKSNWKYYICATDDNLDSNRYKECLESIR